MKIGELFFEIGAKNDKFVKGVNDARISTALFAGEVAAGLWALDKFIESSSKSGASTFNLARTAGVASDQFHALAISISKANGLISDSTVESDLARMSQAFLKWKQFGGDIGQGGFLVRTNRMPNMNGDFLTFLNSVADITGEIKDNDKAIGALSEFGLSPQYLDFFKKSAAERQAMLEQNTVISNQGFGDLDETQKKVNEFWRNIETLRNSVIVKVSPQIQVLADNFSSLADGISKSSDSMDKLGDSTKNNIFLKSLMTGSGAAVAVGKTIYGASSLLSIGLSGQPLNIETEAKKAAFDKIGNTWSDFKTKYGGMWGSSSSTPVTSNPINGLNSLDDVLKNYQNINTNVIVNTSESDGRKIGEDIGKGINQQIKSSYDRQVTGGY